MLFFDGSKSRDATALVGCRVDDGHVFTLAVWEPDCKRGEAVDVDAVDLEVERAFQRFQVAALFADVREWQSLALTEWPRRYADRLTVAVLPAGTDAMPSTRIVPEVDGVSVPEWRNLGADGSATGW